MNLIITNLNLNKHPIGSAYIFLPINNRMSLGRTGDRLERLAVHRDVSY